MGADGSAYVVVGIGVTKTTFFVTQQAGIQCPKGHRPKAGSGKFCGDCGGAFRETSKEAPTPDFKAWAERLGHDPDEVWEMLNEYEGGIDIGAGKKNADFYAELGIHHVSPIESSEHDGTALALGFRVLDQSGEGRGSEPNVADIEEFTKKAAFLEALAKELKIDFLLPVKVHLTFYWSV